MRLEKMNPPPHDGLMVFCVSCGVSVSAAKVLCDLDGRPGDYYCPECIDSPHNSDERED